MFWIVETEEQFKRLLGKDLSECFLEIITGNDYFYSGISDIIALYLRPLSENRGYIIPINHSEGLNEIPVEFVWSVLFQKMLYVFEKSKFLNFVQDNGQTMGIKMGFYLQKGEHLEHNKFNTTAHTFFYSKYHDHPNVNSLIPLSKHHEKWENFISKTDVKSIDYQSKTYHFYNNEVVNAFAYAQSYGIKISKKCFQEKYTPKIPEASVYKNFLFSEYNLYTLAGRPSNSFNGINLAAIHKTDGSRNCFIPRHDYFIEYDFNAYHPRILANIIEYDFGDDDVHTHFAKIYFNTDIITDEQYSESKSMTFKLLYKESSSDIKSEFIEKVQQLREFLWEKYNRVGYIISPISKRKLTNIKKSSQILPYLCQVIETERNALLINQISEVLMGKKSRLVLYTYDSFLFDYSKEDGKEILSDIERILVTEEDERLYPVNIKIGKNYGNMR